jgi:hypothetical protein
MLQPSLRKEVAAMLQPSLRGLRRSLRGIVVPCCISQAPAKRGGVRRILEHTRLPSTSLHALNVQAQIVNGTRQLYANTSKVEKKASPATCHHLRLSCCSQI